MIHSISKPYRSSGKVFLFENGKKILSVSQFSTLVQKRDILVATNRWILKRHHSGNKNTYQVEVVYANCFSWILRRHLSAQ